MLLLLLLLFVSCHWRCCVGSWLMWMVVVVTVCCGQLSLACVVVVVLCLFACFWYAQVWMKLRK